LPVERRKSLIRRTCRANQSHREASSSARTQKSERADVRFSPNCCARADISGQALRIGDMALIRSPRRRGAGWIAGW
jgi:hypothetical protein